MKDFFEYTVDDEEPMCGRCDHMDDFDKWCMDNCGSAHFWNGYRRTEINGNIFDNPELLK